MGAIALGLGWGFEHFASQMGPWRQLTRSLAGAALRQLVEVGPIEEGTKLGGVLLASWVLGYWKQHSSQPSTLLLCTGAIALGFTAEENWIYLFNNSASIFDRTIGTPTHAWFAAPWGYALGIAAMRGDGRSPPLPILWFVTKAWLNAVGCHALVNIFSIAWGYPSPLNWLSYGLFPFLLWLLWRMDGLIRRSQGQSPLALISGPTPIHRYWQQGLAIFALVLGGNAILGLFLLVRNLNAINLSQVLVQPDPAFLRLLAIHLTLNFIPGLLAWGIYRHLRNTSDRRYY